MRYRPPFNPLRNVCLSPLVSDDAGRLCRLIEVEVAAAFAVPLAEMQAPTRRSSTVAFARQSAMYLAHVAFGLSYSTVASLFSRDRTTAAYACRLVEERREDPTIDGVLYALEDACAALPAARLRQPEARP